MMKKMGTCFILIAALCLVVILFWPSHYLSLQPSNDSVHLIAQRNLGHKWQPNVSSSVHNWPVCHRNWSMVNVTGFSDLPERLQNFLFYRHCKHFPMRLDLPNKCSGTYGSDIFLLLVIKSPPENFERRQVLRETWAKERTHNGAWIRRVFISGTTGANPNKGKMSKLIEVEHKLHGDILQWDVDESFLNLTLKQVLFLEWLQVRCPHARFLLNGDDDIFAHTDNMVEYLQAAIGIPGSEKHLFTGNLMQGMRPVREPMTSKYCVPVQVQESDIYPAYCSGGGFMLSRYTATVLYNMSKAVPLHPIDDAYMGMCLERAGLKPTRHRGVHPGGLTIPSLTTDPHDPCYYKDVLMVHRFQPQQLYIFVGPSSRSWTEVLAK